MQEKDVCVSVNGEGVHAEPDTLKLALFNLLDNALRFAEPDSVLTVEAKAGLLRVSNQGPQIPDYALARVTERFYSLPAPGQEKSSGLGLAMVQEIASLHEGTLKVENTADGVAVTLHL